jgi:hypothetical protein
LFRFLHESLNRLTLLEALETIQYTCGFEDLGHRLSRQRAVLHPVIHTVFLQMDCCRLRARVVNTENFQKAAIARGLFVRGDDTVGWLTFQPNPT